MGLTLYHCHNARSFRALWALEELGLTYELHMLPFPPRAFARDYLKINPLGTIPFFIDGETRMTESAAIAEYLAARYGDGKLGVRPDEPAFGTYLNALDYGEATLTFPQTLVLRYLRLEPEERRQPTVAADYAKWFLARLRALQAILETSDYVAANRFTAADISVGSGTVVGDTVITQPTAGVFEGFVARCTHAGCKLPSVTDGTLNCPCHGSKFKITDGSVVTGPAPGPLPAAPITVAGGKILLQ